MIEISSSPRLGQGGLSIGSALALGAGTAGPTPAEQIAAMFDGHDGVLLLGADASAYFLTNLGQVNVSADNDTIGLALDQRLMGGAAAGAFIDALAKTEVTGWTDGGWDVFSSTGTAFEAEKTVGGGTDLAYSNAYLAADSGDFFVLEADIDVNTLGGNGGGFSLSLGINVRSTVLDIAAAQTGTVRGITHYTSGTGSPFSISIRTTQLGALEASSARGAKLAGNHLSQSSASQRPRYYTAGLIRFDGFDDRLIGAFTPGASGNTIALNITVPATVSATQVFAGCQADSSTRFYIGVNTSGQICAGVGTDGTTTIVGSADERGNTIRAFLRQNGTTVDLIVNGVTLYSQPQNGSVTATVPFIFGGLNNNGTPASFAGMDLLNGFVIDTALSNEEIATIDQLWS